MTHFVLNQEVRKELIKNYNLFLVFRGLHSGYDDEIDPIHNPDYVRSSKKDEEIILEKARAKLSSLEKEWNKLCPEE